jgi:peroxiredoxin
MLSDGDGDLVKALGLVDDMGYGLGVRSQRFALVVESGVVCRFCAALDLTRRLSGFITGWWRR